MSENITVIIVEDDGSFKELLVDFIKSKPCRLAFYQDVVPSEAQKPTGSNLKPTNERAATSQEIAIANRVTNLINDFGFSPNLKGYRFLREAIIMSVNNPDFLTGITRTLYPIMAEHFHTTSGCIERNMRNSIELVWDRGNQELIKDLFCFALNANRKPTNSEFIAVIADKIRLELSTDKEE